MLRRLTWTILCAVSIIIATLLAVPHDAAATPRMDSKTLVNLASARFSNLTRAERALLEHAEVTNVGRGDYAVGGLSPNPDDASNNPKDAGKWDAQREIRSSLIRWMSVDPDAIRQIDPQGIRVLGAKIIGSLNLSQVQVPFAITLRNCAIPEPINLDFAEIGNLDLSGSYTGSIHAKAIEVSGTLRLADGFHASALVDLKDAKLGYFVATNGPFKGSPDPDDIVPGTNVALTLLEARITGSVWMDRGFESEGGVVLVAATVSGDLVCLSSRFINSKKRCARRCLRQDRRLRLSWGRVALAWPVSRAICRRRSGYFRVRADRHDGHGGWREIRGENVHGWRPRIWRV
jgi:hypothetical protein